MDETSNSLNCNFCGLGYILPGEDANQDANLPLVLQCGHIFCTACVVSMGKRNRILCPECKVESELPENGVGDMEVDTRFIGLMYTTRMNKKKSGSGNNRGSRHLRHGRRHPPETKDHHAITEEPRGPQPFAVEKALDEGLALAAENMSQLEHIHQTLLTGRKVQVAREKARLHATINEVVDRAVKLIYKRKDALLSDLASLESFFYSTNTEVSLIERRMKELEIATQKARGVRSCRALESYCNVETVLEILQRPVDVQSVDMSCITMDSGLSCVLQADSVTKCLDLYLKLQAGEPKILSEEKVPARQQEASSRKVPPRGWYEPPPVRRREFFRRRAGGGGGGGGGRAGRCSTQRPGGPPGPPPPPPPPLHTPNKPGLARRQQHGPANADTAPDVVVEELIEEEEEMEEEAPPRPALLSTPPGRPRLPTPPPGTASNTRKTTMGKNKAGTMPAKQACRTERQLVQVIHVESPNHFYVRYLAERKQSILLTRKISDNCSGDGSLFSLRDTVKTGGVVCVFAKEDVWCRATVEEIIQRDSQEVVTSCPVTKLSCLRLFLPDYGFTKNVRFGLETESHDSMLEAVNQQLRKILPLLQDELERRYFAPQAIKCSLKDLIPMDLARGWSREARSMFRSVVGSAAVEMQLYGQDKDCLLVDLRKTSMDFASEVPISVREYLVLMEMARFYTSLPASRTPLQYYPCTYPKVGRECNAVVTHINSPSDFYIQLIDNSEFLLLSSKLQDFYSSLSEYTDHELQLYCPVLQQACVACYNHTSWSRAKVIGHPGGRRVEVMYVDFGNKDILSVSELRKIKDEFFSLPVMAIQCCLSNVCPHDGDTWNETTIKRFHGLTFQKAGVTVLATAKAPKSKPLPVSLYQSSLNGPLTNINELLIAEELACFRSVGNRGAEPCAEDSPVWDPPLEVIASSGQESLPNGGGGGSVSDQGSLRGQSLDTGDFQPNLELLPTACLDELKVRVTHVNSPGSFYVQLTRNFPALQLKKLSELLRQDCVSAEPQEDQEGVVVQWEADMFCAVLINGCWERGRVCSTVPSTNMAEVRRCDYGNKVSVHTSSLRPLQASLVGSLALECTLCDIRPAGGSSTWTATACDFMSYYLTGAMATITIKELTEQRPVPVSLSCSKYVLLGKYVCIADFLVSEGLALKERRKPRETSVVKTEDAVSGPQADVSEPQADVSGPQADVSGPQADVSGPQAAVSGPQAAVSGPQADVSGPQADVSGPQADVSGPQADVSGPQADVSGPQAAVSGPSQDGEIEKDVPDVDGSLTPPPTPPPLPPPAVSRPTLPVVIPMQAPKPAPRTALTTEKVKTSWYQPPELPPHGPIRLTISAVGDDGVIYGRTYHAVHQLKWLKSRIKRHMKEVQMPVPRQQAPSWRSIQGCVVYGADMRWHRGHLLEQVSRQLRVRYVDSGQVENFPYCHVYPRLLCEEVPQLCVPCQLYGVIPLDGAWQPDAVALLRNLLVGSSLDNMQVMELPVESRGCVTVQIFLDGLSVSRIMCHHLYATVDESVPLRQEYAITSTDVSLDEWDIDSEGLEMEHEPLLGPFSYPSLPEEGERFRVRVKHLCTPNEVFLVPVEEADAVLVNGETLEEAMNKLNAYKDRLTRLSNYPLGCVCLAEYSDGRYYRSKLMDFVSVNPPALLVQHVDFGSDDTVPTSKLRHMPAELLMFPASALKVRLSGFGPPRVSLETDMLPYRPEWSVKAAQLMIDLLHGKITASVVTREPELTVLLYAENGELVHLPLVDRLLADLDRTEAAAHHGED